MEIWSEAELLNQIMRDEYRCDKGGGDDGDDGDGDGSDSGNSGDDDDDTNDDPPNQTPLRLF